MQGRLSLHPRGFGFVVFADALALPAAFVAPPLLNGFLLDDIVDAELTRDGDKATATSLRLVRRAREAVFGHVVVRASQPFLRMDKLVSNTDWPLRGDAPTADTAVVCRVDGDVVRDARVLLPSEIAEARVLCRHNVPGVHDAALIAEAEALAQKAALLFSDKDEAHRRDLRGVVTVTIDSDSTRDIDDALMCLGADDDGAIRVIVAIADVAGVVPAGSALDLDAQRRATSVYLPGRVFPMLPSALSEGALSLNEGEDRPALTAELRIDVEGRVVAVDVHEAFIRSTARLNYDDVTRFLEHGDGAAVPAATHDTLLMLHAAFARLSQARAERGGRDVERDDVALTLDADGHPVGVHARPSLLAHQLVERLMVAANEAVAGFLVTRGLPGAFRVHEPPTLERTQALADAARALGIAAHFSRHVPLSPRALSAFARQVEGTVHEATVDNLMMRLLGKASYTPIPAMHFGLAAPLYLHFTSPIRRYADVLVHRSLRRFLRGDRTQAARSAELMALCEHLNDAATRAAKAESERERMLVARHYQSRIGDVLDAVAVAHKPQGTLVQIPGGMALVADVTLPLGSQQRVRVLRASEEDARIDVACVS